jgi:hypothetical protein
MRNMLTARRVTLLWCGVLASLALAAPAGAGSAIQIRHPCGSGRDATELVTRAGPGTRCRTALATMRAWRRVGNPSRFRGHRCGSVRGFNVDFTDTPAPPRRWFATWQCRKGPAIYRIWTRY